MNKMNKSFISLGYMSFLLLLGVIIQSSLISMNLLFYSSMLAVALFMSFLKRFCEDIGITKNLKFEISFVLSAGLLLFLAISFKLTIPFHSIFLERTSNAAIQQAFSGYKPMLLWLFSDDGKIPEAGINNLNDLAYNNPQFRTLCKPELTQVLDNPIPESFNSAVACFVKNLPSETPKAPSGLTPAPATPREMAMERLKATMGITERKE